jgi:crossover junction endodeoxyribonuclease RuvC
MTSAAWVRRLLPACQISTADAADALAVAICHAFRATEAAWPRAAA